MDTTLSTLIARFPAANAPRSPSISPITAGLINDTFAVEGGYILQRLNTRIFRPEVNLDIAALTPHLRAAGLPVPEYLLSDEGRPWINLTDGHWAGAWRLMTRLPGSTLHRLTTPARVGAAAEAFARLHGALLHVQHDFASRRPGAHDTQAHLRALQLALDEHPQHRLHPLVAPLASALFDLWDRWGELPELPPRIIHGDPKASNLLFDERDQVSGLLDLDTFALDSLQVELGDAARSWCNPSDEDNPNPSFDLDLFNALARRYLASAAPWITDAERDALPRAPARICLELAARFAADALHERYFGWNPAVAPSRGDHNLLRARGQLALAIDAHHKLPDLQRICQSVT